jgi:hypothetical protein
VLLVWSVLAFLLAWWPWNVWLVVGAAYASRLKGRSNRRLFASDAGEAAIGRAKRIEQGLVAGNGPDALQEYARIIGDQHFSHTPGQPLIDGVATARRTIDQRSIHNRARISERVDPAA